MINFERKEHYGLSDLLRIVALLRSEDGCPWDRVQTHASLRRSLLEEAYEAAEAIDREDPALLKEELGDLLFSVVNVSRFLDLDSEYALTVACDKFIDRFKSVEFLASQRGINMKEASLRQLDALWEEVKASRSQSSYSDEYKN